MGVASHYLLLCFIGYKKVTGPALTREGDYKEREHYQMRIHLVCPPQSFEEVQSLPMLAFHLLKIHCHDDPPSPHRRSYFI